MLLPSVFHCIPFGDILFDNIDLLLSVEFNWFLSFVPDFQWCSFALQGSHLAIQHIESVNIVP